MKETYENLKKLFLLYNDKNFTFYNPNKNKKKKDYENIFLKSKKNKSSLLFGNKPSNQLSFSTKLCRIEKYNPQKVVKNQILKINSLDKNNKKYKLFNNKQERRTKSLHTKNYFYKVSKRILDSEISEYDNTLLNILNNNNYNNNETFFHKSLITNSYLKRGLIYKKVKNAETNTYNSMTNIINEYDLPIINNNN